MVEASSVSTAVSRPVLIVGGSGLVGAKTAHTLRQLYRDLPITIGGRDLKKAKAVADSLGNADAVEVDLTKRDLGQGDRLYSAVAMFVKDQTLNSMRFAQDHGLPYVSISTGIYEMGPEIALFAHRPTAAPILMNSTWLAGAATLPALYFAKEFRTIKAIEVYALLDSRDLGGPAADADFERLLMASPHAPYLKDGAWAWTNGSEAKRTVRSARGIEIPVTPYSPFDVLCLSAATDAHSIRFEFAMGTLADNEDEIATEIIIDISGETLPGEAVRKRYTLSHPKGQMPITAAGVSVAVERLMGLDGNPIPGPGLYLPELLIEPEIMIRRLKQFGLEIDQKALDHEV
jgi:hypothetical protein